MGFQSRREVLKASVPLVAGFAGCTGTRPSSSPSSKTHATHVSRQQATATSTWPQFAHDAWNTSYNSETIGPQTDVTVAWTAPLTDSHSPLFEPVVTDAVYTTNQWRDGTAYALKRTDGTVVWRNTSLPSMRWPAAVHEDQVLVITRTSDNLVRIHALDSNDGTQTWETPVTASNGRYPSVAPTVTDDRVFVASDTGVLAIKGMTGEKLWSRDLAADVVTAHGATRDTVWSTPTVRGGFVYTFDRQESVKRERHVYALNRETGERRWTQKLTVPHDWWTFDSHVIADEKRLFVTISGAKGSGGSGGEESVSKRAGGRLFVLHPESGAVRWTHDFDGTIRVSALGDSMLYVPVHNPASDTNMVYALDLEERRTSWSQIFGGIVNTVSATRDTVYVSGEGLAAVTALDGTQLWNKFTDQLVGFPIIANETTYVTYIPEGTYEQIEVAAVLER